MSASQRLAKMIARIHATLRQLRGLHAYLEVGPIWYEVFVPTSVAERMPPPGNVVTLHTFAYIEQSGMGGAAFQRLFGFLDPVEREFFEVLTSVSGLGMKKAARAMAMPVSRIAQAIERADERTLKGLPEIGPKTARKIIAELQGKVGKYALLRETVPAATQAAAEAAPAAPVATTTAAGPDASATQYEIVEEARHVLRSLNYHDREADVMIERALVAEPDPANTDQLIQAIFRLTGAGK
ncbi:MAG: Holliday junction branch migration protein RuvA [Planctomycetota bacterium]